MVIWHQQVVVFASLWRLFSFQGLNWFSVFFASVVDLNLFFCSYFCLLADFCFLWTRFCGVCCFSLLVFGVLSFFYLSFLTFKQQILAGRASDPSWPLHWNTENNSWHAIAAIRENLKTLHSDFIEILQKVQLLENVNPSSKGQWWDLRFKWCFWRIWSPLRVSVVF